jgi:hypothetical protein
MVDTAVHLMIRPTAPSDTDVYVTSPQAAGLAYCRRTCVKHAPSWAMSCRSTSTTLAPSM